MHGTAGIVARGNRPAMAVVLACLFRRRRSERAGKRRQGKRNAKNHRPEFGEREHLWCLYPQTNVPDQSLEERIGLDKRASTGGPDSEFGAFSAYRRGGNGETKHRGGSNRAGANAVGNADAAEGVAGNGEARDEGNGFLDAIDAVEVAGGILRHGAAPAIEALDARLRGEVKDLAKFALNDGEHLFVGKLEDGFVVAPPRKQRRMPLSGGARWGNLLWTKVQARMRRPSLRGTRKPWPPGRLRRSAMS